MLIAVFFRKKNDKKHDTKYKFYNFVLSTKQGLVVLVLIKNNVNKLKKYGYLIYAKNTTLFYRNVFIFRELWSIY